MCGHPVGSVLGRLRHALAWCESSGRMAYLLAPFSFVTFLLGEQKKSKYSLSTVDRYNGGDVLPERGHRPIISIKS